jgi:hypothetical protein
MIVHRNGRCQDCGKTFEDMIYGNRDAKNHSRDTGHEVHVETAKLHRYKNGKTLK